METPKLKTYTAYRKMGQGDTALDVAIISVFASDKRQASIIVEAELNTPGRGHLYKHWIHSGCMLRERRERKD